MRNFIDTDTDHFKITNIQIKPKQPIHKIKNVKDMALYEQKPGMPEQFYHEAYLRINLFDYTEITFDVKQVTGLDNYAAAMQLHLDAVEHDYNCEDGGANYDTTDEVYEFTYPTEWFCTIEESTLGLLDVVLNDKDKFESFRDTLIWQYLLATLPITIA